MLLECGNCKARETVEHSEVESDVFLINDGIVRYCKECSDSTLWKRASEAPEEQPVLVAAGAAVETASSSAAPPAAAAPTSQSSQLTAGAPPVASAYASPGERKAAVPLDNRRKHPRTRVTYKACIRRSGIHEDVVTCEDMSKGGLSFKSRKQYYQGTEIEVAVPYSPGGNAIFVPARIAWVVEVVKDKQYRCGVAYRLTSRAS